MFARVARFEGGDPSRADDVIAAIRKMIDAGAPEGLEGARHLIMLVDREGGTGLGITLFDDEESLRRGNETLNAMTPPVPDAGGQRTSVEMYEVAINEAIAPAVSAQTRSGAEEARIEAER